MKPLDKSALLSLDDSSLSLPSSFLSFSLSYRFPQLMGGKEGGTGESEREKRVAVSSIGSTVQSWLASLSSSRPTHKGRSNVIWQKKKGSSLTSALSSSLALPSLGGAGRKGEKDLEDEGDRPIKGGSYRSVPKKRNDVLFNVMKKASIFKRKRSANLIDFEGGSEGGKEGGKKRRNLLAKEEERRKWVLCAQYEVAEFLLLSLARSFIHCTRSPDSDFVLTKGEEEGEKGGVEGGKGGGFSHFKSEGRVCGLSQAVPITSSEFAPHIAIEESSKLILCGSPHTISPLFRSLLTSLSELDNIQRQKGIFPFSAPVLGSNPSASVTNSTGIGTLVQDFKSQPGGELKVMRIMTDPSYLKLTFVRNPFTRMLSTYNANPHGDPRRDPQNAGGFRASGGGFFGLGGITNTNSAFGSVNLRPSRNFRDFLRRVHLSYLQSDSIPMEPILTPQINLCGLDIIQYDFVSRYEDQEVDRSLGAKLRDRIKSAYAQSKLPLDETKALGTDEITSLDKADRDWSVEALASEFDKASFEIMQEVYSVDMEIPLNNVTYSIPEAIRKQFER